MTKFGPEGIDRIFASDALHDVLGRVLESKKLADIAHQCCRRRGILFDVRRYARFDCDRVGISICTQTPTMAVKLKQIQPSLEKAFFDHGIYQKIIAIRAGRFASLPDQGNPPAQCPARVGTVEASISIEKNAQSVQDDDVKAALERLAQAVHP